MKLFLETTVWDNNIPNHTYILEDDKSRMHGYIQMGHKEPFMFKKPIGFSASKRTFKMLGEYTDVVPRKPWPFAKVTE
jgi:hypothetical protein